MLGMRAFSSYVSKEGTVYVWAKILGQKNIINWSFSIPESKRQTVALIVQRQLNLKDPDMNLLVYNVFQQSRYPIVSINGLHDHIFISKTPNLMTEVLFPQKVEELKELDLELRVIQARSRIFGNEGLTDLNMDYEKVKTSCSLTQSIWNAPIQGVTFKEEGLGETLTFLKTKPLET